MKGIRCLLAGILGSEEEPAAALGEGSADGVQEGAGGFAEFGDVLHEREQALVGVEVGAGGDGGLHADGDELVVVEGEAGQRDFADTLVEWVGRDLATEPQRGLFTLKQPES
jgi:hypothetical protein